MSNDLIPKQIKEVSNDLMLLIDELLPPVSATIQAQNKLLECLFWIREAFEV